MQELIFSPSDFVAVINQTLEYAYPGVTIAGELMNLRVSKNKWVYFDLKDDLASVKFFGTVYQLPGPLEDGLMMRVKGLPRVHPQYGFSINVQSMQALGEGSIKRAAALLETKLRAEGLFNALRKRMLPYPPNKIGLITSSESAAYADFMKILKERWAGLEIYFYDVQVQGDQATEQITKAIRYLNSHADPIEVLVIVRGGGSSDDLAVFNTEQVTRAIAASRIPTLVAIGHERDICMAELAADKRASTPSNAAELLVPDRSAVLAQVVSTKKELPKLVVSKINRELASKENYTYQMREVLINKIDRHYKQFNDKIQLIGALNPMLALMRGFTIIRKDGKHIGRGHNLQPGQKVEMEFFDSYAQAAVKDVKLKPKRNE